MNRPEETLHRAIVAHLRARLPRPWFAYHIPNGGYRSKSEGGRFKAMGVMPGLPDITIKGPDRAEYCLEVKAPRGSLSPAQRDAIAALAACGIETRVVRSLDEALEALVEMGVPLKGKVL